MIRLIIFLPIIFLVSCAVGLNQRSAEKITPIPPTSKKLDIPKYSNGLPYIYWHYSKQKEAQLNLPSPEVSNDSLLIRVWAILPNRKLDQQQDLVEIKFRDREWEAQVVNMSVDLSKDKLSEKIKEFKSTKVKPTLPWKVFLDSLSLYKISSLPTDEKLPQYVQKSSNYANIAPTFCIEYTTKDSYRFYQYNNVWELQNHYNEAKNMFKIINFINSQFNVDSLAKSFWINRKEK